MPAPSDTLQEDLLGDLLLPDARGRSKGPQKAVIAVRPLCRADLPGLSARSPTDAPRLRQIRHSHHQLARLMAGGTDQAEIALITGYSPAYISTIKNDPQFAELMATYAGQRQLAFIDVLERMKSLGLTCLEELQERLAEDADGWSRRELMELAELLLIKPQKAQCANPPGQQSPAVSINVKFVGAPDSAMLVASAPHSAPVISRMARLND